MSEILVFGADWCGDCRRSKRLLERLDVPYRYLDCERDESLTREAIRLGGSKRIPVIRLPNGSVLVEPSDADLEAAVTEAGLYASSNSTS